MGRREVAAVDLFCGAGGLSYGLKQAGISICGGIDMDPICRHPFESNIGATFHEMDIIRATPKFVSSLFPKGSVRILAGCAPCQPFSSYTQKGGHEKWKMLSRYAYLIDAIKPDIVTMENVPGLENQNVFKKYIRTLKKNRYKIDYKVINCIDYGVPQNRRRLVLLASKRAGLKVMKPNVRYQRTVRSAIGHLSRLKAGSISRRDPLHRSSDLTDRNMKRMKRSKQGGTWRDWDRRLLAKCHKRGSGSTYSSVYGRMKWDEPSPTITTQFYGFGSGRFGHPTQDRALSLREGAILQSFPERYSFVPSGDTVAIKSVGRMIGNAVPVRLGRAIGDYIMDHLKETGVINGR